VTDAPIIIQNGMAQNRDIKHANRAVWGWSFGGRNKFATGKMPVGPTAKMAVLPFLAVADHFGSALR